MVSGAEVHIRWQVLVGHHFGAELWANLHDYMARTLENAARELVSAPIIFPEYPDYEHRVFPTQTQTNTETGVVRELQRVLKLMI